MTAHRMDPAQQEVIRNYLIGAAEEAWTNLKRCAYSLNIKERGDCSAAVFDGKGEMIAIPPSGVPLHQGSMEGLVAAILARYEPADLRPGDMFVTNDPYNGGSTHTPDYCVAAPIFAPDGTIVAYIANVGHHADIGGRVHCSQAIDNESIFEEGVLIPPVRLCRAGETVQEVVQIIRHNSRTPNDREGDIRAQIAANKVGGRRLQEIVDRLGGETFRAATEALLNYSEQRLRARLLELADGRWETTDYIDGDGVGSDPLPVHLVLEKQGGRLAFDFTDAPRQFKSSRNIPVTALRATVYTVLRTLVDPGMHLNGGIHRVVQIKTTPGSWLDPQHPAAVGDRAAPCQVVGDVASQCIGQVIPERMVAAIGSYQAWRFAGIDPRSGKTYANYESIAGGLGATTFSDGMDAVRGWSAGSMNPPIEAFEQELPMIVRRYELATDSGGAGRWRGGLGMRRDLEIRGQETRVNSTSMRQVVRPPGVLGGLPGRTAVFVLNPDTDRERALPPVFTNLPLAYGDVLSVRTPGGGGLGSPAERPRDLVARDLREGRLSEQAARELHGLLPVSP
ncbi:MAG: hydantoinase B/oxoprolinase family protein [Armatimonadetes bacterium]|nr:hydantoinase B/oxoprolinase family protein [Armatimonadota bacterium]